jgi:hypothetical protein
MTKLTENNYEIEAENGLGRGNTMKKDVKRQLEVQLWYATSEVASAACESRLHPKSKTKQYLYDVAVQKREKIMKTLASHKTSR